MLLLTVLLGAPAMAAEPLVLYLDFSDGSETLTRGDVDNATVNQSSIGAVARYPPFAWPGLADGTLSRRDLVRTVSRRVNELFLPYNVVVTTTRPVGGSLYTMVMIGGSPTLVGYDARIAGVAFMDCDNRQDANLVFAFPTALRGSVHGLTVTIAQEAAHAFGLEHTTDPTDIMYPKVDPAQVRFADRDNPIAGDHLCGQQSQNSHRRLLDLAGAWPGGDKPFDDAGPPDREAPVVTIREPSAAGVVSQPFTVRATVQDDGTVDEVTMEAGGDSRTSVRGPYAWSLAGFPAGPLTVRVTAVDASGNRSMATREIVLAPDEGGGGCTLAARRGRTGILPLLVLSFVVVCYAACSRRRGRL
jgi:hypothetical protein